MYQSVVPSFGDLAGLIAFLLRDPRLFISSSTVMTTGILACVALLSLLSLRVPRLRPVIARPAAALALVFAYFGIGSIALATEILVRFHDTIPVETEIQFVSGLGHLAIGAAGAFIAWRLATRGRPRWLIANAIALVYWMLQLVVLDPPWFSFQGQGALMRAAAFASIAALALATAIIARVSSGSRMLMPAQPHTARERGELARKSSPRPQRPPPSPTTRPALRRSVDER